MDGAALLFVAVERLTPAVDEASPLRDEVVGTKLGAFYLAQRLSAGGMAEVFLGARPGPDGPELAAVKRLLPHLTWESDFVRMFLAEVKISAGLEHPSITRVLGYGTGAGGHFLAMEYVHGCDLRRLLAAFDGEGPPIEFAIGLVIELAEALHYAHEYRSEDGSVSGVVHRDVSPSNVMIGYDGGVKLLDFGIARATGQTQHTRTGTLKGKVGYMSPEQCRGDPIDRRTDVFALGVVLYELCTAQRAFFGATDFAIFGRILGGLYVKPSDVRPELPPELERLITAMLEVEPHKRPATTAAAASTLRSVAAREHLDLSPERRAEVLRSRIEPIPYPEVDLSALMRAGSASPGRSRRAVALVAALTTAVGIGGFAVGQRSGDDPTPSVAAPAPGRPEPPPEAPTPELNPAPARADAEPAVEAELGGPKSDASAFDADAEPAVGAESGAPKPGAPVPGADADADANPERPALPKRRRTGSKRRRKSPKTPPPEKRSAIDPRSLLAPSLRK